MFSRQRKVATSATNFITRIVLLATASTCFCVQAAPVENRLAVNFSDPAFHGGSFGSDALLSSNGTLALVAAPNGCGGNVFIFQASSNGSSWLQQEMLAPLDTMNPDSFGALSMLPNGSVLIIGAAEHSISGTDSYEGTAYVFRYNGGNWQQVQQIYAGDAAQQDQFGNAVTISADGTVALVGAYYKSISSTYRQGAVYVFIHRGDTWNETQRLDGDMASDGGGIAQDTFGFSVAISANGSYAAVGAPNVSPNFGRVYVFARSTINPTHFNYILTLYCPDSMPGDSFGVHISLSADASFLLVGAYQVNVSGNSLQGAAYMFAYDLGWGLLQKFSSSDGAAYDLFGVAVSLSANGSVALVAAYNKTINGNSAQGAAYVFEFDGAVWVQTQRLNASDGAVGDKFGEAVSLSANGSVAIVGAYQKSNAGTTKVGATYVYTNFLAHPTAPASITASGSGTSSMTRTQSSSPSSTLTLSSSRTFSPTCSVSPTETGSLTVSLTQSSTITASTSQTHSASFTSTASSSYSVSVTLSGSLTGSGTPMVTSTTSAHATHTPTISSSDTSSFSGTQSFSDSATYVPASATSSMTPTSTHTAMPTSSPSSTVTPSISGTQTRPPVQMVFELDDTSVSQSQPPSTLNLTFVMTECPPLPISPALVATTCASSNTDILGVIPLDPHVTCADGNVSVSAAYSLYAKFLPSAPATDIAYSCETNTGLISSRHSEAVHVRGTYWPLFSNIITVDCSVPGFVFLQSAWGRSVNASLQSNPTSNSSSAYCQSNSSSPQLDFAIISHLEQLGQPQGVPATFDITLSNATHLVVELYSPLPPNISLNVTIGGVTCLPLGISDDGNFFIF